MKSLLIFVGVVLLGFAACPIAPDFPMDSGVPDSGIDDEDAGVDAGATGSIGATLTSSTIPSQTLAWNGSQVSTSTLDSTTQVTLRGIDTTYYGNFTLQLQNLTAGSTAFQFGESSYSPLPSADPAGDIWTCSALENQLGSCQALITLSDFDGSNIAGTFQIIFGADSVGNQAELSSGNFSVALP